MAKQHNDAPSEPERFKVAEAPEAGLVGAFTEAARNAIDALPPPPPKPGLVVPAMQKIVKTKLTEQHVYNSELNIARIRAEQNVRQQATRVEESKGRIFFVRCRPHYHHGIYFKTNPKYQEVFGMFDWTSAYKELEQPNPYHRDVYCQECLLESGKLEFLPVHCIDPMKFLFVAEREHLFEMPVDPALIARDGPEPHRIFELEWASSNAHFAEREKKRADYDARMLAAPQLQKVGA